MAISALVITLSEAPSLAREAVRRLAEDPRVTLGDSDESRVGAVLETPSQRADHEAFEWLRAIPGVLEIAIASVFYEDMMTPAGVSGDEERSSERGVQESRA